MFSLKIVDSDAFLDMPLSAQALYFHLSMRADDDGFVGNTKRIMRSIGCNDDDLKLLLLKRFMIPFENGVCVVKHWRIHNYIRKDRYVTTTYTKEKNLLSLKSNQSYTLVDGNQVATISLPSGRQTVDVGKDRLGKVSLGKGNKDIHQVKEVLDYLNLKAGTKYRANSDKSQQLINTRFKEGFTLEDFKTTIDNKVNDWLKDNDMVKYLRPETLFGTKFESYLNQQKAVKEKGDIEWFEKYKDEKGV